MNNSNFSVATNYEFTDVYMFSDEEGGAPFIFRDDPKKVLRGDKGIPDELQAKFSFTQPQGVNGGLLTGIQNETTGLVFLGDLIDNQDCSIRALLAMCKLKDTYGQRVLLIGGNRDYNKIRLGFELYITCNGNLPWQGAGSFAEMVQNIKDAPCEFRKKDMPSYIESAKLKPWTNVLGAIQTNFTSGKITDRVKRIYAATLGAGAGLTLFKKELGDMFPSANMSSLNEDQMAKVLCAVQMMMSFRWEGLPADCADLNGLYLNFLEKSHALALFKIDGKYGVVSHGGFPVTYNIGQGNVVKTLTSPFGYIPEKAGFPTAAPLVTLINGLEKEKNNLIQKVQSLRDTGFSNEATDEAHNIINKFVHLTALSVLSEGANAFSSPIVGMQQIPIEARKGDLKVTLKGGSTKWINANKAKANANKKYLNTSGETIIAYDIFGHMPQGFVPTAYRAEGTSTLHVNLDISKVEGATNTYSFAMLHLEKGKIPEFIGRFKMPSIGNYKNLVKEFIGTIIYYRTPINDGPVKLLKNTQNTTRFANEKNLPIKVIANTKPPFTRRYYPLKSSNVETNLNLGVNSHLLFKGGRKHTRKAKHHKKRGTRKH